MDQFAKIRKIIQEAIEEAMVSSTGELQDFEPGKIELSDKEFQDYFKKILMKYKLYDPKKQTITGRIVGHKTYIFDFPMEAKDELDALGIYYTVQNVSNKKHPEYGSKYIETNSYYVDR